MKQEKVSFEEKIEKLQIIINELENGNTNLEDSIDKYTLAMKLAKECDQELKSVEEKISKIVKEDNSVEEFKSEE